MVGPSLLKVRGKQKLCIFAYHTHARGHTHIRTNFTELYTHIIHAQRLLSKMLKKFLTYCLRSCRKPQYTVNVAMLPLQHYYRGLVTVTLTVS